MHINDVELQALRERWREGKYRAVQEALERTVPQADWMDLCDAIDHPVGKRLANDLRGVQLLAQDLKNLDLGDSLLDLAVFDRSRFNGAQFQWSIMNGASFRECTLRLTQMIIVFGEAIDFHGATFERAYIEHAQIEKSNFSTVVMQGGTLSNSNVKHCDFSGMQFANGKFENNDARRGDFSAARFVDCNFSQSLLNEARLIGASFDNCDLSGVDFRGANLDGVDFRAGTFWSAPDGTSMGRTRFDDTPAARRAVERSTASGKQDIEW
ncbi:pentapeptide repeat-containing protein [Paraburkholderia sp. J67]|uniref:pentapeptide repeat-containing protein n=1 Tax=Paraburkholderia sp. J67 TaxID=2805435 RepID=UPI002ABE79C8|nr:pentapeptide repeat-containing protein [Paraburkholderia sp. J67]